MPSVARLPLLLALLFVAPSLSAQPSPAEQLRSFAHAVAPAAARRAIAGLAARAEVRGPRGTLVSEMLSLADGTARFRLVKGGEVTDRLLAGDRPYQRSSAGDPEKQPFLPAEAAVASFVRGHEVHRMLLDLDTRFLPDARATTPGCLALRGPDALAVTLCRAADSELPGTLELELPAAAGGGSVTLELADWRPLLGVRLPFAVEFVHAGERHSYRYTTVLPFRIAPGAPLPMGAGATDLLFDRLGDLAQLAAAHARVLEAHRRSDVAMLLADAAERSTSSGRGVLSESGRDELAARLGPYLASTRFHRYDDVVPPVVAISADGTLGWLACQIEAAGTQQSPPGAPEPVAFGFSWVELYARQNGDWRAIGNASSALPGHS